MRLAAAAIGMLCVTLAACSSGSSPGPVDRGEALAKTVFGYFFDGRTQCAHELQSVYKHQASPRVRTKDLSPAAVCAQAARGIVGVGVPRDVHGHFYFACNPPAPGIAPPPGFSLAHCLGTEVYDYKIKKDPFVSPIVHDGQQMACSIDVARYSGRVVYDGANCDAIVNNFGDHFTVVDSSGKSPIVR